MPHKKVLIITYYWPPSGGSGVQRWLKFVKYLPDFGWEPIVFTPENPGFVIKDPSLNKDVSPSTSIIKFLMWEPYRLFQKLLHLFIKSSAPTYNLIDFNKKPLLVEKLAIWIIGNVFVPDPKVCWVRSATQKALKIMRSQDIPIVITTGPPHSMHLIGLRLKRKLPIQWIADFRDPWSEWDKLSNFRLTPMAYTWHQRLERKVLSAADKVITVSKSWQKALKKVAGHKVEVLTNGFDEADFASYRASKPVDKFRISHVGLISSFRKVDMFWTALQELCQEHEAFAKALEVNLVGQVTPSLVQKLQSIDALKNKLVIQDYLPHEKVMSEYERSALLLLIQNKSNTIQGHIPGKFFEYLGAGKPILLLGASASDLGFLVKELGRGAVCDAYDLAAIKLALKRLFDDYLHGKELPTANITSYTRSNLTKTLATKLDELVN